MKLFYLILLIVCNYNLHAQKSIFARVYNLSGQKINSGIILMVTDTSLQLKGKPDTVTIPVRSIGFIKTKRSAGNNILIGVITGASAGIAYGIATADPDEFLGYTAGQGAAVGVLLGAPVGAAAGGLTALFKNTNTYTIDGDGLKWKALHASIIQNSSR